MFMARRLSLVLCNKYPSTNNTHIRVELLLSSDQDSSTALCAYHHTGGSIVCVYVPSLGTPFCGLWAPGGITGGSNTL